VNGARAAGGFDPRRFAALAALCALAAPAIVPYQLAVLAQLPPTPASSLPLPVLGVAQVAGTLLLVLPLAAAGLALHGGDGRVVPLLDAVLAGAPAWPRARAALQPGLAVGAALGLLLLAVAAGANAALERELAALGRAVPHHPPAWTGVLAACGAGVIEETAFRLFLLSAVAAVLARAFRTAAWHPAVFGVANLVAAIAFGSLHFVNVAVLGMPFSNAVVIAVLVGNGALGLAAGALFRARGLEAAIACHVAADLVLHGLGPALGLVR
jgi:hypothetical protein